MTIVEPRTVGTPAGLPQRSAHLERNTRETKISIDMALDPARVGFNTGYVAELETEQAGQIGELFDIDTGVPFFDHMLAQLARHSGIGLRVKARGDVHIDDHHTVEDVGIALGQALKQALDDKNGIARYGSAYAPMDESLARAALDISGRPFLVYEVGTLPERVGTGFDTQLIEHFFQSFTLNAGITLHIDLIRGKNTHHIVEAIFKAAAQALKQAIVVSGTGLPSTKGVL